MAGAAWLSRRRSTNGKGGAACNWRSGIFSPASVPAFNNAARVLLTFPGFRGTFHLPFFPQTKEGPTMFCQTEAKPQGWRAMAVFDDRGDRLLYLGRSSTQVRAGFTSAFFE